MPQVQEHIRSIFGENFYQTPNVKKIENANNKNFQYEVEKIRMLLTNYGFGG
jgi:hypothetical protein